MCGFVAMLGLNGTKTNQSVVERMADTIRHRGPDDGGIFVSGSVGFGFRRLSILDLSPTGHQPMVSSDGQAVLVFNGEIYNYLELRKELEGLGHSFQSTGDSEVLLHAYLEWGSQCLNRLNGMWAFLIYDRRDGKVFGSRDRFGKKPLYLYRTPTHVLLASEIKAILASGTYAGGPNWPLVSRFFLEGNLDQLNFGNETFYSDIVQIRPGAAFEIDFSGGVREWQYWSVDVLPGDEDLCCDQKFYEIFEDAVRLRLRSDVPVGIFLSGGLDSTSIACTVAKLRKENERGNSSPFLAFSFQAEKFDESAFIAETVKQTGVQLVLFQPDPRTLLEKMERMLWYQDEPVHSMVAVITFELSRLAAERGVKVILNGGGADETLAGYPNLFENYWFSISRTKKMSVLWNEIVAYSKVHESDPQRLFLKSAGWFMKQPIMSLKLYRVLASWRQTRTLRSHPWFSEELTAQLPGKSTAPVNMDLESALKSCMDSAPLPFYLRLEDRNSMAHSVEARMPFLDYRLVSFANRLPVNWKMRGGWSKYVLRESMRGRIPESVRTRPDKMGFPVPTKEWFAGSFYEPFQDLLSGRQVRERGIYNVERIRQDIALHREGKLDVSGAAFNVMQYETWSGFLKQHTSRQGQN